MSKPNDVILATEYLRSQPVGSIYRVQTPVAKEMLLQNNAINIRGTSRWLRMKNLGLGVWELWIAELGTAQKHLIVKK